MLIIMRGLPSSGKSYTAKELAGENGLIFSTDEYFYKLVKPDQPDKYSFNPRFLAHAHKWNLLRTQKAIDEFVQTGNPNPIIVDNTNTEAWEAHNYVLYAHAYDIPVEIHEPTSEWWQEIRLLLNNASKNKKELKEWAKYLADLSQKTHSVPAFAIEKMMWRWQPGITVEQVLESKPSK